MDIKARVDIGDNITNLIEKLAAQIGTTADKVFPWYVQQAYMEGITTLVALAFFLSIFTAIFVVSFKRADFNKENRYVPLVMASGIVLVFVTAAIAFEGTESVRKLLNPNYYAMKMLTRDVGRLAGR